MKYLFILFTAPFFLTSMNSFSASEDECAIWLCLPTGFPSGCSGAKDAFIDRITSFPPKSPLPSFAGCLVSPPEAIAAGLQPSEFSFSQDYAAYVPAREVCTKTEFGQRREVCVETAIEPEHYVKDTRCVSSGRYGTSKTPEGCTETYFYVDVFIDGVATGETYYWQQ